MGNALITRRGGGKNEGLYAYKKLPTAMSLKPRACYADLISSDTTSSITIYYSSSYTEANGVFTLDNPSSMSITYSTADLSALKNMYLICDGNMEVEYINKVDGKPLYVSGSTKSGKNVIQITSPMAYKKGTYYQIFEANIYEYRADYETIFVSDKNDYPNGAVINNKLIAPISDNKTYFDFTFTWADGGTYKTFEIKSSNILSENIYRTLGFSNFEITYAEELTRGNSSYIYHPEANVEKIDSTSYTRKYKNTPLMTVSPYNKTGEFGNALYDSGSYGFKPCSQTIDIKVSLDSEGYYIQAIRNSYVHSYNNTAWGTGSLRICGYMY